MFLDGIFISTMDNTKVIKFHIHVHLRADFLEVQNWGKSKGRFILKTHKYGIWLIFLCTCNNYDKWPILKVIMLIISFGKPNVAMDKLGMGLVDVEIIAAVAMEKMLVQLRHILTVWPPWFVFFKVPTYTYSDKDKLILSSDIIEKSIISSRK